MRPLLSVALVTAALVALPTGALTPHALTPDTAAAITLPPAGARFDYQLGGASAVPAGARMVVRDSTDAPAAGVYSVCYVNGFQTQPGEQWPSDLLVAGPDGAPLVDPNWPDEHLLDISTAAQRQTIAARLATTVDRCASAGFQAVEFDNLDSWLRSEGTLDADDAVAFATLLTAHAHDRRLAVAQKNATDLGSRGRDAVGFDFAITEECDRWDECGAYTDVYGGLVFDVEYTDDLRGTAAKVCARIRGLDPSPSAIIRDRDLVPASDPAHAYRSC